MKQDFHPVTELFDQLVEELPDQHYNLWHQLGHKHVETGYRGRRFIVFQMHQGEPRVIDTLDITAFEANDRDGMAIYLSSAQHGDELRIGYRPTKLWGHRAFMALPLHSKLRWASSSTLEEGKLAFPVLVKVASRHSLRDIGVDQVATSTDFARGFNRNRT